HPRADQAPGRPDRVCRVFSRRDDHGVCVSQGVARRPGRGRARQVPDARTVRSSLQLDLREAGPDRQGRDARARHRSLAYGRAEARRRGAPPRRWLHWKRGRDVMTHDNPNATRTDAAWLDAHWMPFTGNRQFKAHPRMFVAAEGAYYTDSGGRKVFDGLS